MIVGRTKGGNRLAMFKQLKKWGLLCLMICCVVGLTGCQNSNSKESTEPFDVHFFYSSTCNYCASLRSNLLSKIQEEFGDQVTIYEHEIDDEESKTLYDTFFGVYDAQTDTVINGQLEGVTPEDIGVSELLPLNQYYVPVLVIGDYYAFMGYDSSFDDDYLNDIHLALRGEPLSSKMAAGRWEFKKDA